MPATRAVAAESRASRPTSASTAVLTVIWAWMDRHHGVAGGYGCRGGQV